MCITCTMCRHKLNLLALLLTLIYTVFQKKLSHLLITLADVGRFSKFFHQMIHKKILYVVCTYHKDFHLTCNMLLNYLVKVESTKMLPNFHVERNN